VRRPPGACLMTVFPGGLLGSAAQSLALLTMLTSEAAS
jgi:hypothetical protein